MESSVFQRKSSALKMALKTENHLSDKGFSISAVLTAITISYKMDEHFNFKMDKRPEWIFFAKKTSNYQ